MELQIEAEALRRRSSAAGCAPEDLRQLGRALADARSRVAELERELARQARERAELVHLVGHELRNPLTVLSGFGRLLEDEASGPLNETQRHYVAECLRAGRRLERFVGDLMAASPETGNPLAIDVAETDLHRTLASLLESLSPMLAERGLRIETDFASGLPRLLVDALRIEQVVTNLLTNALRYGRAGGCVRLSTRVRHEDGRPVVEVAVEDDGPGIPAADRERLFAPYVRGAQRADEPNGGLGIGLAICSRIVAAHAGRICAEASPLGGARLVFTLPLAGRRAGGASSASVPACAGVSSGDARSKAR
ncbi:MAG: HAMP domain-containing histidine kinase [Spirochaetaceae bacterium]|nr:HAMP domain-containing histidine kinase [Myxococcales bacterium]MCB9726638.1 HAMP domain-containing histidine kinase [Spirochaetaceae bacterium]HPG26914.1 HAMP domain-containing sensor histidine kinase [Myxococcota bacterium]